MARYIDADLLIENIAKTEDLRTLSTKTIGEAISNTPTADVEEVKHGEWLDNIKVISTVGMTDIKALVGYRCSVCGRQIYTIDEDLKDYAPYCHCGAKMDR